MCVWCLWRLEVEGVCVCGACRLSTFSVVCPPASESSSGEDEEGEDTSHAKKKGKSLLPDLWWLQANIFIVALSFIHSHL